MLAKEEHKSCSIFVHRPAVSLYDGGALNNVGQLDLLVSRELRDADFGEFFIDILGSLLREVFVGFSIII